MIIILPIGLIIHLIKMCIVCYKNGDCKCSCCHKEVDLETGQETDSLLKNNA